MRKLFSMIGASLFRRSLKLRRDKRGSAAVEFSILAPLFFGVMFSGFEAGLMYLKIGMVDHGMSEVSRMIYAGNAKGLSQDDIIDAFCDAVDSVIKCDGNVTLEIRKLSDYSNFDAGSATCVHTGEELKDEDKPAYSNTSGGEIVYIRMCVTTDLVIPGLKNLTFSMINVGLQIPETSDGKYRIASSTVFRNEPF